MSAMGIIVVVFIVLVLIGVACWMCCCGSSSSSCAVPLLTKTKKSKKCPHGLSKSKCCINECKSKWQNHQESSSDSDSDCEEKKKSCWEGKKWCTDEKKKSTSSCCCEPGHISDFYLTLPAVEEVPMLVQPSTGVPFPSTAATDGFVLRDGSNTSATVFVLPKAGKYIVFFNLPVNEAAQVVLALDTGSGFQSLDYTVTGRNAQSSLITGEVVVTTTIANSKLALVNPNNSAFSLTPTAGGSLPATAHLIIQYWPVCPAPVTTPVVCC